MTEPAYWRIRMKYAQEELTREAWDRNEVGIWYGAWSAKDLVAALKRPGPLEYLSQVNKKNGSAWDVVPRGFLSLARRFGSITRKDWVLVYFDGALHLAHVCSEIRSSPNHPLNRGGELFKYRKISHKKPFSLDRLPDAFRLLRAAGRGNVFQPRGSGDLVKLLGQALDEEEVTKQLETTDFDTFLRLLGPTSWESVCQAYLSIEFHFIPTGLRYGGTLPDFDIVGRRSTDGARILAQCKKNPNPAAMEAAFIDGIGKPTKRLMAFYFTYGGCTGVFPAHAKVIDRNCIIRWSKTRSGSRYFKWLRGG